MLNKDQIMDILREELGTVYCDTCIFDGIEENLAEEQYHYYGCDYCHRKNMNWVLSPIVAQQIADKILGGNDESSN